MSKTTRETLPPPPKRKELSDNPVKLCHEIARLFRDRMREKCEIDGVMSQPGARLVLSLLAMGDGRSQRELVAETHLKPPTVSVIVKKMVEEGMAELKADPLDLRITRVYLTDKGRQVDRENIQKIKAVDAQGLRGLSSEEQETLMVLLGKIRKNLLENEEGEKK